MPEARWSEDPIRIEISGADWDDFPEGTRTLLDALAAKLAVRWWGFTVEVRLPSGVPGSPDRVLTARQFTPRELADE